MVQGDPHADLLPKSKAELEHLLSANLDFVRKVSRDIQAFHIGSPYIQDLFVLERLRGILEERIRALQDALELPPELQYTLEEGGEEDLDETSPEDELWEPPKETEGDRMILEDVQECYGRVLRKTFGLKNFRINQAHAISETLDGRDVVLLMPTGSGKSLTYQLPAVVDNERSGQVTVVISPLIALMNDQMKALDAKGIYAVALNSDRDEVSETYHVLFEEERPALLYITPEKMKKSEEFRSALKKLYEQGHLARFAIDEAHCISTWGHEFRDAYRELHLLRERFPDVPIMALTACSTPKIVADIVSNLQLHNPAVIRQSLNRVNLSYTILQKRTDDQLQELVKFLKTNGHMEHSGIIYRTARYECKILADHLQNHGVKVAVYHAGMSKKAREETQAKWMRNEHLVVVATIAFGMGIDKPDVRFVVHYDMARSMENYIQETGRAGRDGKPADCVMYYTHKDAKVVLKAAQKSNQPIQATFGINKGAMDVVRYCEEKTQCRRRLLLRHFGEKMTQPCNGTCSNCCNAGRLLSKDFSKEAKQVLTLFKSLMPDRMSVNQLLDVFLGRKNINTRKNGRDGARLYATGTTLAGKSVYIAELLFGQLLLRNALQEYKCPVVQHWYLKYGPKFDEILEDDGPFDLTYHTCQKIPVTKASYQETSAMDVDSDMHRDWDMVGANEEPAMEFEDEDEEPKADRPLSRALENRKSVGVSAGKYSFEDFDIVMFDCD